MRSLTRVVVLVVTCLVVGAPLAAQSPDITGTWSLQVTAYLPDVATPCTFEGTVQFTMLDGVWTGPANLTLISGPEGCPAEMMATCTGTFDAGTLTGTLDGGKLFGMASFTATPTGAGMLTGTIGGPPKDASPKAALATKVSSYNGGFSTMSGPFAGVSGMFVAARQSVVEIPTLTETGLLLLAILLMATATFLLLRGRRQEV